VNDFELFGGDGITLYLDDIKFLSSLLPNEFFQPPECPNVDGGWDFAPSPPKYTKKLTAFLRPLAGFREIPVEETG